MHNDAQQELLRIDDLAHLSGLPSRTIRFYNTQGMLPPPLMHGRVAYYTQEHLTVLGIIRELKEQQKLPLEVIKQLLEIRAQEGNVQMSLALKQRMLTALTAAGQTGRFSQEELALRSGVTVERIDELIEQGLLFPVETEEGIIFTGDDVLLLELYQRLEQLRLPLALPALIRFQLRQLARSELAAYEQHLLPHWREEGLSLEQQTEQFEKMLALTDTLISVMHRKLLYQA